MSSSAGASHSGRRNVIVAVSLAGASHSGRRNVIVAVSLVVFVSWLCCTHLSLLMKFSVVLLIKKKKKY